MPLKDATTSRVTACILVATLLSGCVAPSPSEPDPVGALGDDPSPEAPDRSADWTPSSQAGQSSIQAISVCTDGCFGYTGTDFGQFTVYPAADSAVLNARWVAESPSTQTLRVSIYNSTVVAEATGTSPLQIEAKDLGSGGYKVGVAFTTPLGVAIEQTVDWEVLIYREVPVSAPQG